MKAWVLNSVGNISYEERNLPVPDDDSVIIKVKAAGICGSDIPRIYKNGAHAMPLVPGHEFAGEIAMAADDKLIGKRAAVFPLIPCMKCEQCRQRKYEMCENYNYLGSRCDGGFAEYVKVPLWNIMELPDEVSYESAAMLEPMAVAVHAIRKMNPEPGKKVAVIGLGTIGLLIIMFLKKMGIEGIYAVGNKKLQKEKALEIGLNESNYFDRQLLTKADYIFECVGKNETINMALEFADNSGKICLVGNPYSDMNFARDTYWKILRKQLTLLGTWNSSYGVENDDWNYVIDRLKENKISPESLITQCFSLADLDKGLQLMRDKSEEYIKVMIEV